MGVLTLQNFRDELSPADASNGSGALQRPGVSNTLLDRWINAAIKEFAYAFKFHELEDSAVFTTVDGQGNYQIGAGQAIDVSNLRYIEELFRTAPSDRLGRILPESRTQYNRKIGDQADSLARGNPEHYHKYGLKVFLRPIPDATLVTINMDYGKNVTPLVNVGDVTQFSEDWDEAVVVGAMYRAFRYFGEYDRYQNVRNDFLGIVRSRSTEMELEEFPEGAIQPSAGDDESATETG